ncbi:hypothetical protein QFC20_006774 [Naganishia adeliensis]|uniref:Uncharacterized protein n=1 Tax=Naganishia adeliensis TaxID=92952 RepID=A0ACC2V6E0_9TREE|nr:hypothetical protein QFC20_006774 [Naganishia adeliensis]
MNPYIPEPQLPITHHPTLASVLAMNAELNARNDLLLASLRKVAAEDDAFRQKHLGCDLTIEALQEENESLRKELNDRTKIFERGLKAEEVGAGSSKRRSETV